MLWHLAAEDGREGDMVNPQGQVFQIFDFFSSNTIDLKDPYLGTGNFTATIPLPNSLSPDLEGGFKNFEKKIREKTPVLYYNFLKRNISYSDVHEKCSKQILSSPK